MASKYKLYFFAARGRFEFIRYMFLYANVPYEEVTIARDDWAAGKKQDMPFAVLPVLELENGNRLSQSLAIGRYLGAEFGLISKDRWENALGDQVVGAIEDLYRPYVRDWVNALNANDQKKIKEAWEELENNGFVPLFDRFDKMLGDKQWFCGKNMHWADLYVAELTDRLATTFNRKEVVAKFPHLLAHCRRVHDIPAIKKYVETRPKYER